MAALRRESKWSLRAVNQTESVLQPRSHLFADALGSRTLLSRTHTALRSRVPPAYQTPVGVARLSSARTFPQLGAGTSFSGARNRSLADKEDGFTRD